VIPSLLAHTRGSHPAGRGGDHRGRDDSAGSRGKTELRYGVRRGECTATDRSRTRVSKSVSKVAAVIELHVAGFSDLDAATLYAILRLRSDVFVVEQGLLILRLSTVATWNRARDTSGWR